MTLNEACNRASLIWSGPTSVQLRPDGGADIALDDNPAMFVGVKRYTLFRYHRLDANGHAVCHNECAEIESALS